jgi:hypothetical protein
MQKVYKVIQIGKNKFKRKTLFLLSFEDIAGIAICTIAIGYVVIRVLLG